MKTVQQWWNERGPHFTHLDIAEIQRDAREGMVPEEDLQILLRGTPDCDSNCGCDWCKAVDILRAKHPNLFTK